MSVAESNLAVEYRPVAGFPDYRVGSDGSVWSKKRGSWYRLSVAPGSNGYLLVNLRLNARPTVRQVHRVVLEAFVGFRPEGTEAAHDNGNKLDNSLGNLYWKTHSENIRDQDRHGTARGRFRGLRPLNVKLTTRIVVQIREAFRNGKTRAEVARDFGISWSQANRIASGTHWKDVA